MSTLYCACDRLKIFTAAACSPRRTAPPAHPPPPRHAARSPLWGATGLLPSCLPCGATLAAHRAKSGRGRPSCSSRLGAAPEAHPSCSTSWGTTFPARRAGASRGPASSPRQALCCPSCGTAPSVLPAFQLRFGGRQLVRIKLAHTIGIHCHLQLFCQVLPRGRRVAAI
jgi:hypothetical protein